MTQITTINFQHRRLAETFQAELVAVDSVLVLKSWDGGVLSTLIVALGERINQTTTNKCIVTTRSAGWSSNLASAEYQVDLPLTQIIRDWLFRELNGEADLDPVMAELARHQPLSIWS